MFAKQLLPHTELMKATNQQNNITVKIRVLPDQVAKLRVATLLHRSVRIHMEFREFLSGPAKNPDTFAYGYSGGSGETGRYMLCSTRDFMQQIDCFFASS